jgi:hypothetical protein
MPPTGRVPWNVDYEINPRHAKGQQLLDFDYRQ